MSQTAAGERSPLVFKHASFERDKHSSRTSSSPCRVLRTALRIPRLVWDFTESNFSTFVVPNTAFGVLGALTGAPLTTTTSADATVSPLTVLLLNMPLAVAFNWYSVLVFDLANQRGPESVEEDLANKPWRPIPSGKVTAEQTRRAMLVVVPLVLGFNYLLGVWREGVFILVLTWLYNDLRGGDTLARDAIIAAAYYLFNTASLKIAVADTGARVSRDGHVWAGVISAVILTTMQVQDLKDQAGDRGRGRSTIPLYFGDGFSRVSLAVLVPFWSCVCLYLWRISIWSSATPSGSLFSPLGPVLMTLAVLGSGAMVAAGVLRKRTPESDGRAWRLWCLWTVCLYALPLAGNGFASLGHV
ncbi:hypothetical protein C8034_v010585 [Colletotrichum sidae]|uniref:Fumagillin beta-trans-bergamotene synthase n=1 Tax=Colletotrichum sidae TaxID=1347389 RepID=A0A4R8TKB2_9PEZI|nr:hypothetical protein C8034_v010585 [Colletotrichum sidae]